MSVARMVRRIGLAATLACGACAHSSAPRGWLPAPAAAQASAYGGWIELTYHERGESRRTDGELIAVTADSVWVLTDTQGVVIPTSTVEHGKLTAYAAQPGTLRAWTVLGTLATISNGGFLVFTAPMWLIGGSLAVGAESRSAERAHPPLAWPGLAPYARFPQGLPEGVGLTALQPKRRE
jgi:hypothetical protein